MVDLTRSQIMILQPGPICDNYVALGMGWTKKRMADGKIAWYDGETFYPKFNPSLDWCDIGIVIEKRSYMAFNMFYLMEKVNYALKNPLYWQAEWVCYDYYGAGPLPIVIFRATSRVPLLTICRASLMMAHDHYVLPPKVS